MKNEGLKRPVDYWKKGVLVCGALTLLLIVYFFQRVDPFAFLASDSKIHTPYLIFAVNRAIRVLLNDLACFILIFVFFERKHLQIAFLLFLVEFFIILPLYLVVKLSLEGDSEISSPLLSQVHRLIVNPTLMFLLMMGFLYQKFVETKERK